MKWITLLISCTLACGCSIDSTGGKKEEMIEVATNEPPRDGFETGNNTYDPVDLEPVNPPGWEPPPTEPPRTVPVLPEPGPLPTTPLPAFAPAPVVMPLSQAGPEFRVGFGKPGAPVPPGLATGVNDYNNASAGAWSAYSNALSPRGGLVRLWLRQARSPLSNAHYRSAKMAMDAGLDVFLCVKGAPENYVGNAKNTKEANALPPADPERWARDVVQSARNLLNKGVRLTHIEIWNEPDLKANWLGNAEQFADFFARAGKVLQDELPDSVKLGGPGMARGWGPGLKIFARMLDRCRQTGFVPDFLSWHHYNGYPSDPDAFDQARRAKALFAAHALPEPEIILSEWNVGLPGDKGAKASLDNHKAGVHFIAETTSLVHADFDYSMWFFLQDLPTEATSDYTGESVGIFTLNGAPKASLNGMRMFRRAAALPAVPIERVRAPWNITLLATREGDRGYILLANALGSEDKRARKLLDVMGVDLADWEKGSSEKLKRYLAGKGRFEDIGAPPDQRQAWERARAQIASGQRENALRNRPVIVEFDDAPASITQVWALDKEHGNPAEQADFLNAFSLYKAEAHERAVTAALAELEKAGFTSEQLTRAAKGLRTRDKQMLKDYFGRRDQGRVDAEYKRAYERLVRDGAVELTKHPQAQPALIQPGNRVRLANDVLEADLPPWSALLIEVRWSTASD